MVNRQRSQRFGTFLLALVVSACSDDPSAQPVPPASGSGSAPAMTSAVGATTGATATATAAAPVTATAEPATSATASTSSALASSAPTTVASSKPTATSTTGPAPTTTTAPTSAPTTEPVPTTTATLPAPEVGSADAVAAAIDGIFKDHNTFKARFLQKHKQKITGKEREQKGTVYVLRPNKISFRYDAPNNNRIVSDGSTLKLYVAEDAQMFEHPVKDTEYPGAFGFIMGSGIRSSFEFTFNEKVKFELGPVLVGKPRTANPQYEQVLFYVDKTKLEKKDPGAVTGVLILDAQGNRNRFELFDQSFPDKIDASEFTFTPPAGTNITK